MARPPISLRGLPDKRYVMAIWNDVMPPRRRRLHALMLIWDAGSMFTRTRLAEFGGRQPASAIRWVAAYNRGGIEELLNPPRHPPAESATSASMISTIKFILCLPTKNNRGILGVCRRLQKELA